PTLDRGARCGASPHARGASAHPRVRRCPVRLVLPRRIAQPQAPLVQHGILRQSRQGAAFLSKEARNGLAATIPSAASWSRLVRSEGQSISPAWRLESGVPTCHFTCFETGGGSLRATVTSPVSKQANVHLSLGPFELLHAFDEARDGTDQP